MATHHSAFTFTQTFSPSSEVVTMQQIGGAAHKLKPRSFHKVCSSPSPLCGLSPRCEPHLTVGLYVIEEVVSTSAVKLRLPSSMRIHLVVNVSQIVRYKEQVKRQKKEEGKPVEIEEVEEWKVKKILNKKKMRGVVKYLI